METTRTKRELEDEYFVLKIRRDVAEDLEDELKIGKRMSDIIKKHNLPENPSARNTIAVLEELSEEGILDMCILDSVLKLKEEFVKKANPLVRLMVEELENLRRKIEKNG